MATMTYTYTKDKNIYRFTCEQDSKTYSFDVNTGLFYSPTGKAVKSMPVGFGKFLDRADNSDSPVIYMMNRIRNSPRQFGFADNGLCVLRTMTPYSNENVVKYITLADRLASIGYNGLGHTRDYWREFDVVKLDFVAEHFVKFAAYFKRNNEGSITDFVNENAFALFVKKYNLDNPKFHLNEREIRRIYNIVNDRVRDGNIILPYISEFIYFAGRGLFDFYESDWECRDRLIKFFSMCAKMDYKPQKEDFFRQYINVKREYEFRKAEIDKVALARNYAQKADALNFEFGDYQVVLPTCAEDFADEGRQQHNCVGGYVERVTEGTSFVVFIRNKNNLKKSVVTCEISRNGSISQFNKFANEWVTDGVLYDFKRAYADHLAKNW